MAVEAQVCPQCGATIQFGVGQTEIVCSHCGTTVVKAAAQGGSSVEKELAAEKLVQETVRREKKLHAHGRPATGKIVTAEATDIFRPTVEGRAVLMALTVEVQPEGEPGFTAEAKVLVGLVAVGKYQAGTLLDVRYDPQDHAQVSVEGRHGVPSSNPEEQARKRQAKEQAQRQAQQAWRAEEPKAHGGPAAPAWGGAQGHGAVPVPVEFDAVTSLGPAVAVHLHTGLRLPHFGPPRPNVVVVYREGLAYHTGKDVHTWRWEDVAAIQSNVWYTGDRVITTEHEYTLIKTSGETMILDDQVKEVENAAEAIKRAVFARLGPPLTQAYGAGSAVVFGPVSVHKQNGLQLDGKSYAWSAILDIKSERGRLAVTLRDGKKHEARCSAIPNVELLAKLIGLQFIETAYY